MSEERRTGDGTRRSGFLAIGALIVLGLAALGAGLALGTWRNVCHDCPSIAQLYSWEPKQSTKIFGADSTLLAELFQERRTPVSIDDLPPYVPQAFIAVEDRRFYDHPGFSVRGIVRAAIVRLPGMRGLLNRRAGGGSTITQQLARNMFVERVGFDQTLIRKLKELRVAQDLEAVYSKNQILQAYMNQVNYGHGWYGIESAAQNYFGKPATQLEPDEAALLAAVINRPGHYSPLVNPDRARERRNLVLELMADQGRLDPRDAEQWKQEPVPEARARPDEGSLAPYFVEWVRRTLDDRYGSDLYERGYRIYTTLDVALQREARSAMERGWRRIETIPTYEHAAYEERDSIEAETGERPPYLQGMFLSLDPRTGEIRAMIGGRDFGESKFNRATQAMRQPGSIFKPFVYSAAIASGIPASHVIYDSPIHIDQLDGTVWSPRNYTNDFRGPMTLREALRRSTNVVAVKLGMEVGLETVAQFAQRMGIRTPIPRVESTAIGAPDVIPIQVAEAYTTFANVGTRVTPRGIRRVEDAQGRVLWETEPERQDVLARDVAYVVLDMMRGVVDQGSAYSVRDPLRGNVPDTLPVAGKTGTTNDHTDVWFAGLTPNLLAVVWFGFDLPQTILPNAAGGGLAAPVWADFANAVYFPNGTPPDSARLEPDDSTYVGLLPVPGDWVRPDTLVTRMIDSESGGLATEWCPTERVYEEIFIPGTEPTELCDLHGPGMFGGALGGLVQVRDTTTRRDSLPPDSVAPDSLPPDSVAPGTFPADTTPRRPRHD